MLDGIVVVLVFKPVLVETGEFAAKPISLQGQSGRSDAVTMKGEQA